VYLPPWRFRYSVVAPAVDTEDDARADACDSEEGSAMA
jgi:hypothetical protein